MRESELRRSDLSPSPSGRAPSPGVRSRYLESLPPLRKSGSSIADFPPETLMDSYFRGLARRLDRTRPSPGPSFYTVANGKALSTMAGGSAYASAYDRATVSACYSRVLNNDNPGPSYIPPRPEPRSRACFSRTERWDSTHPLSRHQPRSSTRMTQRNEPSPDTYNPNLDPTSNHRVCRSPTLYKSERYPSPKRRFSGACPGDHNINEKLTRRKLYTTYIPNIERDTLDWVCWA